MANNQTVSTPEESLNKNGDSYVSLRHIDKIYDNNVQAVFDFNLEIKKKEFIVFVGPSGCGKSTTLRMIAGLEDISAGELWIDGVYSNDLMPRDRGIAMVFQSYALYPHMSVYDNMAFGLRVRKFPEEEIDKRVHEAAKILEIEQYLDRKPKALSGGQRQRVALGRAIVRNAKVFLMDEPLSNLDAKLRIQMRSEIIKLHHGLDATTIYVTHDQTEAMTMASRIVVMKAGTIQQIGTPFEIYNNPDNLFVAGFIGSPPMNFLNLNYENGIISFPDGQKIKLNDAITSKYNEFFKKEVKEYQEQLEKLIVKLQEAGIDAASIIKEEAKPEEKPSLLHKIFKKKNDKENKKDLEVKRIANLKEEYLNLKDAIEKLTALNKGSGKIIFSIRPEDVHEIGDENANKIKDKIEISLDVETAELLGHEYQIHSTFDNAEFVCTIPSTRPITTGDKIQVFLDLSKIHLFDEISTKRIF